MQLNPFNDKTQNNIINYKIAKCKNWEKDGTCRYGNKCTFAHGDEDLRKKEDNMKNMSNGIPMFMVLDQNGNPMMFQPQQGFDYSQMQMMPINFDQNQLMMGMGMMPQNANIPQEGNMGMQNNINQSGNNNKNQQ